MKFVADENIDNSVALALRGLGHEVKAIVSDDPGAADESILSLCQSSESILLTGDKDFGDLIYRMKRASEGVILLRLAGIPTQTKARIVADFVLKHENEIRGNFSVITPGSVRIRKPD
ncbi:MAG: DUF5615 family PIN-like protein [Spirochaetia bacterium]|nr:DUF5615 family PIN-like protein [Spirochaetia bacterium]